MVEVQASRVSAEILAGEGTRSGVTRIETQVAGTTAGAVEVRCSRVAVEVLGSPAPIAGATRIETQTAGLPDAPVEIQCSRLAVEVLGSQDTSCGVTRVDTQVAGKTTGAARVLASRVSVECLARQGSAGIVSPLALGNDAYAFLHNWASNATMTTSFKTSVVHDPETAAESRRGLVLKPFRTMTLEWLLCDGEDFSRLERLEVFLRRITGSRFTVPIYMDQQEIGAAATSSATTISVSTRRARFFPGARVAIVQLNAFNQPTSFSFHIISSMTNNSLTFNAALGVAVTANSIVLPMMDCEVMLEVEGTYTTARVPSVSITVAEAPGASQLPPLRSDIPSGASVYDERPVWFEEPDWSDGVTKGRVRYGDRSSDGRADFVNAEGPRARQTHNYVLNGDRDSMWSVLEFFESRRGRLRSFWHIDQDQYMTVASIDASGTFIGITEIGNITDFSEEMGHIGLIMEDGTYYVREAVTIQQILTVFRITLDSPVASGLSPTDVVRFARARECRFDSDAITETWTHTGYCTITASIVELLNEGTHSTT